MTGNATRKCMPDGVWYVNSETNSSWSNYSQCLRTRDLPTQVSNLIMVRNHMLLALLKLSHKGTLQVSRLSACFSALIIFGVYFFYFQLNVMSKLTSIKIEAETMIPEVIDMYVEMRLQNHRMYFQNKYIRVNEICNFASNCHSYLAFNYNV